MAVTPVQLLKAFFSISATQPGIVMEVIFLQFSNADSPTVKMPVGIFSATVMPSGALMILDLFASVSIPSTDAYAAQPSSTLIASRDVQPLNASMSKEDRRTGKVTSVSDVQPLKQLAISVRLSAAAAAVSSKPTSSTGASGTARNTSFSSLFAP